jgi:hypothetical protein
MNENTLERDWVQLSSAPNRQRDWVQLSGAPNRQRAFSWLVVFGVLAVDPLVILAICKYTTGLVSPWLFVVFGILGIACLVGVGWSCLQLSAPQPNVYLAPAVIRSGESFSIRWELPSGLNPREISCHLVGTTVQVQQENIFFAVLDLLNAISPSPGSKTLSGPSRCVRTYLDEVLFAVSDTSIQREGIVRLQKTVEPPVEEDAERFYHIVVRTSRGWMRKFQYPVTVQTGKGSGSSLT